MAPSVERLLLPCSSLQVARCRWYCSFRQAFSEHKSDTCCSSSSILPLCLSSNSCCVSIILLSSFKYSAALVGFSVGLSMSLQLPFFSCVPCRSAEAGEMVLYSPGSGLGATIQCVAPFTPCHCFVLFFFNKQKKQKNDEGDNNPNQKYSRLHAFPSPTATKLETTHISRLGMSSRLQHIIHPHVTDFTVRIPAGSLKCAHSPVGNAV